MTLDEETIKKIDLLFKEEVFSKIEGGDPVTQTVIILDGFIHFMMGKMAKDRDSLVKLYEEFIAFTSERIKRAREL